MGGEALASHIVVPVLLPKCAGQLFSLAVY